MCQEAKTLGGVCVCVCRGWGGGCIKESYTNSTHQGTTVSLWFCRVLPAHSPLLLRTGEIGQPHIMQGQWGARMTPPRIVPLHSPNPYLYRRARESKPWPPHGHTKADCWETGTASHNIPTSQPQQPFTQIRLNRAEPASCAHSWQVCNNSLKC